MDRNKLINGEALSRERFLKPSPEFGIMPFWFWNGTMDHDEMERQLQELKDKGIPGIFIHARFGIREHLDYLGEGWFDRVRFTIEKAEEMGLEVWVYDEYNWPSGTAGQTIQKEQPDLTSRYLEVIVEDMAGNYFTFMEGTDSRYHDLEQSQPVYACAIKQEDLKAGRFESINLMPNLCFDKVISWQAPEGPWKFMYFIERRSDWYVDVLNPETTKVFLEKTHERYKEHAGSAFSRKIGGFYTDEPAMHYFTIFEDNYIIPWSRDILEYFERDHGYDLLELLPMLFFDFKDKSAQLRYDFWSTLSAQYEESYYKQIGDWCEENGVHSTGHLLAEENILVHARTGGNLFHMLRHFHVTGVDHLYPRVGTRAMPEEHVALKIASSAAHQNGSARLVCESMGGAFWDATMTRMKWIADWEYLLGVNLLNPHGFHYSVEGERKRDWPPSQFYHHSWWDEYKNFNEYMTRLGYVLSGGKHAARTAVLYPINSVWANYEPQGATAVGSLIDREFKWMTDRLLRLHVEFDYVDEDLLALSPIENGAVVIRDEAYDFLILPAVTHIKAETLDFLERFVQSGGRVLADTLLPLALLTGTPEEKSSVGERIRRLFGIEGRQLLDSFSETGSSADALNGQPGGLENCVLAPGSGFAKDDRMSDFRSTILELTEPELEIDSEEVFQLHRIKDGQDLYFIINPSFEAVDLRIGIPGIVKPEFWNLENGDITDLPVYRHEDGKTFIKLHLEDRGSALLATRPWNGEAHLEHAPEAVVVKEAKDGKWTGYKTQPSDSIRSDSRWSWRPDRDNLFSTDAYRVLVSANDDKSELPDDIFSGRELVEWHKFRMGAWELQLPGGRTKKPYPQDVWYAVDVEIEALPEKINLVVDGFKGESWRVWINGVPCGDETLPSSLDAEMREIPAREHLRVGSNRIAICLTVTKRTDGMLDLLKLIGDFGVYEKDGVQVIGEAPSTMENGDWTKQGYPYFSGAGIYTREIEVNKDQLDKRRAILTADVGEDILEVRVNGRQAALRLWAPYEADLTDYLHAGLNRLELRVVNTQNNAMNGVAQCSGLASCEIRFYDEVKGDLTNTKLHEE